MSISVSKIRTHIALLIALSAALIVTLPAAVFSQDEQLAADAIELFNRGQDEHAKGNFVRAIEFYDKALKLLPEFAEAEYQKGNAFLSLGKKVEAEAALRRAVELKGEWTLALTALGTLLTRNGQYAEAEKLLTKAVQLDGSSYPAYAGLVELKLKNNAPPQQLKPLLEKLRVFSSKANVTAAMLATQASVENAIGDRTSAKKSIALALELDPASKPALYEKANIAISESDLIFAEQVVTTIEKLDAGSEDASVLRARLLLASGRIDEARKILSTIKSPTAPTVALIEKVALAAEQSPEKLEKILEKEPKNVVVLAKLCSAYRVQAPDKALDFCQRALAIEPSNIDLAVGIGAALLQAKRYAEAVDVLRRLSSYSPENATIRANLGTALFQLKRYEEAKKEYQWLTAHQPVPPVAYYFLAICHDQLGEYLDAGANYNLFLKHADAAKNQLEIDKVKLRLPILERQIKQQGGRSGTKRDT